MGAVTLNDTWLWDGSAWNQALPALSPSARAGHAMVYDSVRGNIVLFGGAAPGGVQQTDTQTWDGTTWTNVTPASSPLTREAFEMVYDSARNEAVIFGGYHRTGSLSSLLSDTWRWNGTAWTQAFPAQSPPRRSNAGAAFDVARAEMIVFGGEASQRDTWRWNGTTWTQASTPVAPEARGGVTLCWDGARQETIAFGGFAGPSSSNDTWRWNGATWARRDDLRTPEPAATTAGMTFDAERGRVVLASSNGTWLWDGTIWSRARRALELPAPAPGPLVFDTKRGVVVSAGGTPFSTYTWNGATWMRATAPRSPPDRSDHALAFDGVRGEALLFGGASVFGSTLDDTWLWDGVTWREASPTVHPSARTSPGAAFDAARGEVVLFSGAPLTRDTWLWNGTAWREAHLLERPDSLYSVGRLVYDSTHARVLFFSEAATWLWNGVTWTQTSPPLAPLSSDGMAYDSVHDRIVVHSTFPPTTWLGYVAGGGCRADAECPGAWCVDGVCCETSRCGTCESCNGATPGTCSLVLNQEDTDTCAVRDGHACRRGGECKAAPGVAAASAAECATGFLVDGVCCDTACNGSCVACRADLKETNVRSGYCDVARAGTDPHDHCAASDVTACGYDGTCDGRGACRLYRPGVACGASACVDDRATGNVCNGLGACLLSSQGVSCSGYACRMPGGCLDACKDDGECANTHRCQTGACVAREGASCDGEHTLVAPDKQQRDCAPYRCAGGACLEKCASVTDCVSPAACNAAGLCELTPPVQQFDGCAVTRSSSPREAVSAFGLAWGAVFLRARGAKRERRRRRETSWARAAVLAMFGLLACVWTIPARAQVAPSDAEEKAKASFTRGVELMNRGAFEAALAEFIASRALQVSRGNTRNAAFCYEKMERNVEALELYEELLSMQLDPDSEKNARKHVEGLAPLVGTLHITTEPGTKVQVDGVELPPGQSAWDKRVAAGVRTVRAYKSGFMPYEKSVPVRGREEQTLRIELATLERSGKLSVTEEKGQPADVIVDGVVVGQAPFSGYVRVGAHAVSLAGAGDLGSQPARVDVDLNRVVPITLALEPLPSKLRVEPTPREATVTIDGVVIGQGAWQGRLRRGPHALEATAPGYLLLRENVSLDDTPRALKLTLERDMSSPVWGVPSRIFLGASLGAPFGVIVTGDTHDRCDAACSRDFPWGASFLLEGGYRLGNGLAFGIEAGASYQRIGVKSRAGSLLVMGETANAGRIDDDAYLRSFRVGLAAGYRRGDAVVWTGRLGLDMLFGTVVDRRNGTFTSAAGTVAAAPEIRTDEPRSVALAFAPELRVGLPWGHFMPYLGLNATIMVTLDPPLWNKEREYKVDNRAGHFADESFVGGFTLLVGPVFGVTYDL